MLDNSSELLSTRAGSSGESIFSGFGSDYNTPAWSEVDDSTQSDGDDDKGDDFLAELTRQMAENMLQEDEEVDEKKSMSYEAFDLSEEHQQSNSTTKYCNGQGTMSGGTTKSQSPTSVLPNPTPPIFSNQSQKGLQSREYQYGQGSRGPGLLSAYQAGAGMRLVFLGGIGSSSGTGVFLPNIAPSANSTETTVAPNHQPRRKTGCSTVLIPERVLQTLQQHFEKRAAQMPSNGGDSRTQQNQQLRSHQTTPTIMNNQEFQLPQEWTY